MISSARFWTPRLAGILLVLAAAQAWGQVHHELVVTVTPEQHRIEVVDTVTLPQPAPVVHLLMHGGLEPRVSGSPGSGARGIRPALRTMSREVGPGGVPLERHEVSLPPGTRRFTLRYAGEIHHPVTRTGREYARSFGVSPGIVGPDGVYLGSASHWYPRLGDQLVTFDLDVRLPPGWRSMSQGTRTGHDEDGTRVAERWRIESPQDEIFLVAGVFTEYRRPAGAAQAMVLLRTPEPGLAARYLEATGLYLELYRKLIGPYAYGKFALVENFWETGYGMPSFTLLGSRVIRLPFILHSSYPHEILHNWWGNGVYVDYATGNWAEGLTSYLADHLVKEQRGAGVAHRRAALQRYADYVREREDFPVRAFRGRHGAVSEAVGYGKTMMFFHMLRRRLGDERFVAGLRRFYRGHRFEVAGFDDLAKSFSAAAGEPLDGFFEQWIDRTGAPSLRVEDARAIAAGVLPPAAGVLPPAAGVLPPAAGVLPPAAGVLPPAAGVLPPAAGVLPPAAGVLPPAAGVLPPAAGVLPPAAGVLPPAAGVLPPAAGVLPPAAGVLPPAAGAGYVLTATIVQGQAGAPYRLRVPIAVQLEGRELAHQETIRLDGRETRIELSLPVRPLRLDIDPEFDVFRRLDRAEIPPALSQALGADEVLFVLPAAAPDRIREGYERLVRSWYAHESGTPDVRLDRTLERLPDDRTVWLFGWENRFRPALDATLAGHAFAAGAHRVRVGGETLARETDAVVAVARNAAHPEHALAWVALDNVAAMAGLARKLPHYGKYGYLGFRGDEPENVVKGQWPVLASSLSVTLARADEKRPAGRLAPRQALAEPPVVFSAERMVADVRALADPGLEGRGLGEPGLDRAAAYIAERFRALGLRPGADAPDDFYQRWAETVGDGRGALALKNVVAVLPGTRTEWSGESVVVGAHYDHLGRGWPDVHQGDEGTIHPGADDNASGVAVMLELARVMAERPPPERSVVFVAFTGEEAGKLGATHYVRHPGRYPADRAIGMVNLDTVGRLGTGELLVIGAASAREWVHVFRGAGFVTGVPVKAVREAFDSSDQASFDAAGIPAVQLFTGPHGDYHRPGDVADRIDAAGLVKVASVLDEAVGYLTARSEPLTTASSRSAARAAGAEHAPRRRASLGTVPDFAFSGTGVRLSDVVAASPAAGAGLRAGDVVVGIDAREVRDLQAYADALRALAPGQRITIHFLRDGARRSVEARTTAR